MTPLRIRIAAWACGLLLAACGTTTVHAAPQIDIIVEDKSPALEQRAATELATQLGRLFSAKVRVAGQPSAESTHVILVGSPQTNAAVRAAVGNKWPRLSDQGHLVKGMTWQDKPTAIVGGGSPLATLWAACELGHHFGIRYLLGGDMYPPAVPPLLLEPLDLQWEPKFRTRSWYALDDSVAGLESWKLADQQKLLTQLRKLRFNAIVLPVRTWQPFVDLNLKEIHKQTGVFAQGRRFRVDGETAGRKAFDGAEEFFNPDLPPQETLSERLAAGKRLLQGIIDAAHQQGMSVTLSVRPFELPVEFSPIVPNAQPVPGSNGLAVVPSAGSLTDPKCLDYAVAQLQAYAATYPTADAIVWEISDIPGTAAELERAVMTLLEKTPALNEAIAFSFPPKSEGNETAADPQQAKNILTLVAGDPLVTRLASSPAAKTQRWGWAEVSPVLLPTVSQLSPKSPRLYRAAETLSGVADLKPVAAIKPGENDRLILPLTKPSLFPQMHLTALQRSLGALQQAGWDGYAVRGTKTSDSDVDLYYLSRACCDPDVSIDSVVTGFARPVSGAGVEVSMAKIVVLVAQASELIEKHDPHFGDLRPQMVVDQLTATEPPPAWWKEAQGLYTDAMNETYRANTRARAAADHVTRSLARRLEFAVSYLASLEAARLSGIARHKGDREEATAQLEKSVESMYSALDALSYGVQNPSDQGVIAALNEFAYRPLVKALDDDAEQ